MGYLVAGLFKYLFLAVLIGVPLCVFFAGLWIFRLIESRRSTVMPSRLDVCVYLFLGAVSGLLATVAFSAWYTWPFEGGPWTDFDSIVIAITALVFMGIGGRQALLYSAEKRAAITASLSQPTEDEPS